MRIHKIMQENGKKQAVKRKLYGIAVPAGIALLLKLLALFPQFTERYYTGLLYPLISGFQRLLTGWLPFSLGDLLYAAAGAWIIARLYKNARAILRKTFTRATFLASVYRTIKIALWVYVCFNLFWGMNYNRMGIAHQLDISPETYSRDELVGLTASLVEAVNTTRRSIPDTVIVFNDRNTLYQQAVDAYESAARMYPFMHYPVASVKGSLYSYFNSYMGVFGYYNPFSGEAQVNTKVPGFLMPFTVCHEIGHQLGYATEDEANFAGYLAAVASGNHRFRYSAYFEMYSYANRQLYLLDSAMAINNSKRLDSLVKLDIRSYKAFLARHKNPVEPYITAFYDQFLQANNQPKGMNTYDDVIGWLLAYRKKYGY